MLINHTNYNNRRSKSLIFLLICIFFGVFPHCIDLHKRNSFILATSLLILFNGLRILFDGWFKYKRNIILGHKVDFDEVEDYPYVDVLVAAKDEENVIVRLVKMLSKINYPQSRISFWIIDDGSKDNTYLIIEEIAKKFPNLNIIKRSKNSSGGKSGALNFALNYVKGDWLFVLDADAQVAEDTLLRAIKYALGNNLSAVQLRKSVVNSGVNYLTSFQALELAMDAVFQCCRDALRGVVELRGNGQLIHKETLITIGSFNEETITDDLDLSIRLLIENEKVSILWDPPILEEGVDNIFALWNQRKRWAEGGLQRYFDYWQNLLFGQITLTKKLDFSYFFILQYALPVISFFDILASIMTRSLPFYWIISLIVFLISFIAICLSLINRVEGPALPKSNALVVIGAILYLSHWFIIIPWVAVKMAILPKKLNWYKTAHGVN
tara:strand:- start:21304 stop:22620 length:1317 start_codon:yes stop_codon:yes gene_type:complete